MDPFRKAQIKLNSQTNSADLIKAVEKAYVQTRLGENNVKIFLPQQFNNEFLTGKSLTKDGWFSQTLEMKNNESLAKKILDGKRARHQHDGMIIANAEKAGLSIFHEIGHALNRYKTSFGKQLQNQKKFAANIAYAMPAIAALAAIFSSQSSDKKHNKGSEILNNIKNRAAILAAIAYSPVLIEEAIATKKGNKLAKQFCSEQMYKNVVKNNKIGYLTYIGKAVLCCGGAYLASKINIGGTRQELK